ncbi:MAG: asparagine synthase (glutamine-hydrolyzing) [Psychromonas sp.]|jgi:asparagine synthase (glutamine-hydrolysing)|uniref:asparagine synthase (glutamine-hydrolyzing) n=1 Tax=Psychromonas sp. TaxID=1884585 RepID=UPI0039E61C3C
MCAIVFYHSNQLPCDTGKFAQALTSLSHRGPDHSGLWYGDDGKLAIGHNRLEINGGSCATQPMHSSDGELVIAVNGEIYNKRAEIEKQGATFTSESDSEYLLHQFKLKGLTGLSELDGEFAFVIYDKSSKTAYLGRDRFGIKPLFYSQHNGALVAASEIKALLAYGIPAKWNKNYLAGSEYFVQHANETFVEGVYAIAPGNILKISEKGVESLPYITESPLDPSLFESRPIAFNQACDEFESLFVGAIEKRLLKSSSNQTYLSSGIDSSAITAIAARLSGSLHAYSIGFADTAFDESKQAQKFAKEIGVSHDIVEVTDTILANNFAHAVIHSEMPVPNINIAAKYHLSKQLSQAEHKTVLTGEGADESLLGYGFFRQDLTKPYRDLQQFPSSWQPHLSAVQKHLGFLPAQAVHASPNGLLLNSLRNSEHLTATSFSSFARFDSSVTADPIARSQKLHYQSVFQSYNLGALADRTEMAHGIEGRPPFLDNALVEFIHSLPLSYKFDEQIDKRILRAVAGKYMPHSYAQIAKKPFISAPASLRSQGPLAALFQHYFLELTYLPDFYNKEKVRKLYLEALTLDANKQASLDPVFIHLSSLMILQKRFGLSF